MGCKDMLNTSGVITNTNGTNESVVSEESIFEVKQFRYPHTVLVDIRWDDLQSTGNYNGQF